MSFTPRIIFIVSFFFYARARVCVCVRACVRVYIYIYSRSRTEKFSRARASCECVPALLCCISALLRLKNLKLFLCVCERNFEFFFQSVNLRRRNYHIKAQREGATKRAGERRQRIKSLELQKLPHAR